MSIWCTNNWGLTSFEQDTASPCKISYLYMHRQLWPLVLSGVPLVPHSWSLVIISDSLTPPPPFFFNEENFSCSNLETELGNMNAMHPQVHKPEEPKMVLCWPDGFEIENAKAYGQIHSHSPVVKVLWKYLWSNPLYSQVSVTRAKQHFIFFFSVQSTWAWGCFSYFSFFKKILYILVFCKPPQIRVAANVTNTTLSPSSRLLLNVKYDQL